MEFADWIDMAGNILENNRDGDIIKRRRQHEHLMHPDNPVITRPPQVTLVAPLAAKPGQPVSRETGPGVVFDASGSTDPEGRPLSFRWDSPTGRPPPGPA